MLFTKQYYADKENEIGVAHIGQEKMRNSCKIIFSGGRPEGKMPLEDVGVDEV